MAYRKLLNGITLDSNDKDGKGKMIEELVEKAGEIRKQTFEMVMKAGKGHLGGSFSCTEILVALYYGKILRFDSSNPRWEERDRFILSKAHGSNTLYVILADLGFYLASELSSFLDDGSLLSGHTDNRTPGVEIVGGSLGHGLGVASGIALGAKLSGKDYLTFALIGDGESQEGSIWEAAMFASHHGLNNLIAVTDRNNLGSEDYTENTARLEPLADKWRAFGWDVTSIDGHSFDEIFGAFKDVRTRQSSRPLMIIARTIKGKGISFLENTPQSHHTLPTGQYVDRAREDLK